MACWILEVVISRYLFHLTGSKLAPTGYWQPPMNRARAFNAIPVIFEGNVVCALMHCLLMGAPASWEGGMACLLNWAQYLVHGVVIVSDVLLFLGVSS